MIFSITSIKIEKKLRGQLSNRDRPIKWVSYPSKFFALFPVVPINSGFVHVEIRVKVNKKALRVLWGKPLHFLFVSKNRNARLPGREVNFPLEGESEISTEKLILAKL